MSTPTSAPDHQSPVETARLRLFLESIRRDAFVMEVGAYGYPTIAEDSLFRLAFPALSEQLKALFGPDILVVLSIDADTKDIETGKVERTVLTVFADEVTKFDCTRSTEPIGLDRLCQPGENLAGVGESFITKSHAALETRIHKWKSEHSDHSLILAPYFVQSIDERFPEDHASLLAFWANNETARRLVFSAPFVRDKARGIKGLDKTYYASMLFVYCSSAVPVLADDLDWLEVCNLSFQMSWGFPALGEQRRMLALQRRKATAMAATVKFLEDIKGLARDVSAVIRAQTDLLLAKLHTGFEIDLEQLGNIFEPAATRALPLKIHGRQNLYPSHRGENAATRLPLLAYGVLILLGNCPSEIGSLDELVEAAKKDVNSGGAHRPIIRLLKRFLDGDVGGFGLMKALCYRIHLIDAELPLFALAARFLLHESLNPSFEVHILDAGQPPFTLKSTNFVLGAFEPQAADEDQQLFNRPCFKAVPGLRHRDWVQPLVELVCKELQAGPKPNETAYVSSVTLQAHEQSWNIVCEVSGEDAAVSVIDSVLSAGPVADGGHSLRKVWATFCAVFEKNKGHLSYRWEAKRLLIRIGETEGGES